MPKKKTASRSKKKTASTGPKKPARKASRKASPGRVERSSLTLHGQTATIEKARDRAAVRLRRFEAMIERRDDGVYSHRLPYRVYGSVEELAEDIVRQTGAADVDPGPDPRRHKRGR